METVTAPDVGDNNEDQNNHVVGSMSYAFPYTYNVLYHHHPNCDKNNS